MYVCMYVCTYICMYVYVCPCKSVPLSSSGLSTPCAAARGGSHGSLAVERGGWVAGWLAKLLFGDLAGGMAELLDGWLGGAGWLTGWAGLAEHRDCMSCCLPAGLAGLNQASWLVTVGGPTTTSGPNPPPPF